MSRPVECEVCVANEYSLWTRKRALKSWPAKVQRIFKRWRSGKAIRVGQKGH